MNWMTPDWPWTLMAKVPYVHSVNTSRGRIMEAGISAVPEHFLFRTCFGMLWYIIAQRKWCYIMNVKLFGVFVFGVYVYLYRVEPGHSLALLDHVSRAHGIRVSRPSVCGIDYLWTYCMDSFQILIVATPWTYAGPIF